MPDKLGSKCRPFTSYSDAQATTKPRRNQFASRKIQAFLQRHLASG
jgi:hypothetical protein